LGKALALYATGWDRVAAARLDQDAAIQDNFLHPWQTTLNASIAVAMKARQAVRVRGFFIYLLTFILFISYVRSPPHNGPGNTSRNHDGQGFIITFLFIYCYVRANTTNASQIDDGNSGFYLLISF
jgi:hypothetical protein